MVGEQGGESTADSQRRYAAENRRVADRLRVDGHPHLAKVYDACAELHEACAEDWYDPAIMEKARDGLLVGPELEAAEKARAAVKAEG